MSLSVATIVVANSADDYLSETLSQLAKQTHRIQQVMVVDTAGSEETEKLVSKFGFSLIQPGDLRLGAAVDAGVSALAHQSDWLWILHDDSAPEPSALSQLARAAEISPSVAVIGPKLLRWDFPIEIQQMGLTVTKTGRPFLLVESEYDQGQFDITSDTLAVSTAGMLVSRSVWQQLGGLDDSSPALAQDIEFSIKARAAGYRVVVEASARVLHAGLSMLGKRKRSWLRGTYRQAISKAHIQLATTLLPSPLVALLYLSLPVIATVLIPFNLLAKRPGRIVGQFTGWIWAWSTFPVRLLQRKKVRSFGSLSSLASLYASWSQVRAKKAKQFEYAPERNESRKGFFASGAFYITLLLPLIAINQFPTGALESKAFPIGRSFESIWANTGATRAQYLEGFNYPSDPFNWFFSLIALFPLAPSTALAWFVFLALSLAFVSMWLLIGVVTDKAWLRNLFALGYVLSPPLLSLQSTAAVVELVVATSLPLAIYLFVQSAKAFNSARSWRWSALAGLVGVLLAVSNPLIFGLLFVFVLGLVGTRPSRLLPLGAGFVPGVIFLLDWIIANALNLSVLLTTTTARVSAIDFWYWPIIVMALALLLAAISGKPALALVTSFFAASMIATTRYLGLSFGEESTLLVMLATLLLAASMNATKARSLNALVSFATIGGLVASIFLFAVQVERPRQIDDFVAPALVVAQADVDPGTRTLRISFEEQAVADLIWGDGRSVDEQSVLYLADLPQSRLAQPLATLTALLIAANPQGVEELLRQASVSFVIVEGNDARALSTKAALSSMPYFQNSGESRFGSLFRVNLDIPKPDMQEDPDRSLELLTLAAYGLLAIPTPATVRGYRRRTKR